MEPSDIRRGLIFGALALAPATAVAQVIPRPQHEDHAHHGGGDAPADVGLSSEESGAVQALSACTNAGEICLSHCIAVLATGDASMAVCAASVREMLAVCAAGRSLIPARSSFAGRQLALCREACVACRAACEPHAAHHETCGACAEACTAAISAIDALMG